MVDLSGIIGRHLTRWKYRRRMVRPQLFSEDFTSMSVTSENRSEPRAPTDYSEPGSPVGVETL